MSLTRKWRSVLVALMPIGLLLVSCSGGAGEPETAAVSSPQAGISSGVSLGEESTASSPESDWPFPVNVVLNDDGFEPSSVYVPVGRQVRLMLRNRGSTEHHYRVVGLVPKDLRWKAGPEDVQLEGVTDEEHDIHHTTGFMPFKAESPQGIKPIGDEVHGYGTVSDAMDMIFFIPTNTGTFLVECPLHPEVTGSLIVF